jgi:murein DD-endopeptidase MepM/ murein hydrolase activator NlpD
MKRVVLSIVSVPVIIFLFINMKTFLSNDEPPPVKELKETEENSKTFSITGIVKPHDTLETLFIRHSLKRVELPEVVKSAKKLYNLSRLSIGNVYSFIIEKENNTLSVMDYEINDSSYLKILKTPEGFSSKIVDIEYTKKIGFLYIHIKNNLIDSLPKINKEYLKLAFKLSDIFAWDIDFSSDIRNNDSIKVMVEELWIGNVFKGYGNIVMAEFLNNGTLYRAYRHTYNGYSDYYDDSGKSLRKTLLRSPLKFRYISSRYSRKRFHPILRIYRPHLGIDYAAPKGTPVSAAGNGTIISTGYKGQNGKMVRIRHNRGLETFYGHLSRIPKKIKRGVKVLQGDIIGYVGSTGLSTGPHLDYRIKKNKRFVNPLTIQLPRGKSVPKKSMAVFKQSVKEMDIRLSSLTQQFFAFSTNRESSANELF